jgi:hypothetical protein
LLQLKIETRKVGRHFDSRIREILYDEELFSPYMPRARFMEELNKFRRAFAGAVVIMKEDTRMYFRLTARSPA